MEMQEHIMADYLGRIEECLDTIRREEEGHIKQVAALLARQIERDKLIYIWGPGGHSNMNAMEVFFRAGSLMHVSAILDEGTMLSSGALRSMNIERTPGYGRIVIRDNHIGKGDLLILANAYGINTACIDAALECRAIGATTVSVSSAAHARMTPLDHPARHPSKKNLDEVCDYHIDSKIVSGDAVMDIEGIPQKMGAISTFANAYILNSLMMETGILLGATGMDVPIWKSGNAPGGDEWNDRYTAHFRGKIRWL